MNVAKERQNKILDAQVKLSSSIDMNLLLRGTGSDEHERELYKLLAATGIKTE